MFHDCPAAVALGQARGRIAAPAAQASLNPAAPTGVKQPATRPAHAIHHGPTTSPATAPTSRGAQSTPKGTLRQLNLALRDGDAGAIRSLFQTTDDEGKKLVWAVADYAAALAALHRAAVDMYGADGANTVTGDMSAQSADGLAAIDKAQAEVNGDAATVRFADADDPPVHLVKVAGDWKLPLSQLLNGADKPAQERKIAELDVQTKLAHQIASEIRSGKFKGPDKAAEVWRSRLLQAVAPKETPKPAPPEG